MKHVLIVGSQHGNEPLGELLYAYLRTQSPIPGLRSHYYLANPGAKRARVRLIESDMNRSFGTGQRTYEASRAAELLTYIRARRFDLVVDAHTTTVDQPSCIILPDITDSNRPFLAASHIRRLVRMKHDFVRTSLIGHVPQAVSVEVSNNRLTSKLFHQFYLDLCAYALGQTLHLHKLAFTVQDVLRKDELPKEELSTLRNFVRHGDFYPVLMGEAAYRRYTDYIGFKATRKERLDLS